MQISLKSKKNSRNFQKNKKMFVEDFKGLFVLCNVFYVEKSNVSLCNLFYGAIRVKNLMSVLSYRQSWHQEVNHEERKHKHKGIKNEKKY
jgi:hypothetical protein